MKTLVRPLCSGFAASHWAAQLATTSFAVRSLPSLNLTPLRRLKVHSVRSALAVYFSASAGSTAVPPTLKASSDSLICSHARSDSPSVFVGAVEAERLGVLHPDELLAVARRHDGEILVPQRAGVRAGDVSLVGRRGTAVRHRDHRHVLLDQGVGLGVELVALGLVGQLGCLVQHIVDVSEAGAELLAGALPEVVVQEVGLIGVVGAPAQQVQRQLRRSWLHPGTRRIPSR